MLRYLFIAFVACSLLVPDAGAKESASTAREAVVQANPTRGLQPDRPTAEKLAADDPGPARTILARIDGHAVTGEDFRTRYVEYLLRTGVQDEVRLRRAMLEQMVNDRLMAQAGRRLGLHETEAYLLHEETVRRKLLIDGFLESAVMSHVEITEADLEQAFVRINTDLEARHLFARTRSEADVLHERLMNGETFEMLAREVFVDTALANNGGSIGTFTFDELDPDFEDAAFGLSVGDISPPIRTTRGYSIIQVTDRFTKPILTETEYAAKKEQLRLFVRRTRRAQARSHFIRDQAEALEPEFHAGFDRLLAQLTGLAVEADEEMEALLNLPLLTYGPPDKRTSWTVADLRKRAIYTHPDQRAQVRTADDLREFVTGLAIRDDLVARGSALDLDEDSAFVATLSRQMDDWILDRHKQNLAAEILVEEDSIRAHYDRYPGGFTTDAGEPLPFEAVRSDIEDQLRFIYTRERIQEYVATLRRRAEIVTDEKALLAPDLLTGRPHAWGEFETDMNDRGSGRPESADRQIGEGEGGTH